MKKLVIVLGIIALIIGAFFLFKWWAGGFAGGGGIDEIVPDVAKTGEPITIGLILNTWGKHSEPISERYTNIYLYYRLVGENTYKSIQPKPVSLPSNFQAVISDTRQYEKYEFTIPSYQKGTTGEIEYYIDMTFDGYSNRTEGIKKIKISDI